MCRTTLVLLLFVVKLPMTAGETAGVTVHQAEWGDTRGEAPPPSGPYVPNKSDSPSPVFQNKRFRYGASIRYGASARYGTSIRYAPGTRIRQSWGRGSTAYQPNINYRGVGKTMRGYYRPSIRYSPSTRTRKRYGFSR